MLMIYGANGYTGALIARRAKARGVPAVLAGRSEGALAALSAELALAHRCFPLGGAGAAAEIDSALRGITAVLNCAGPFSATAAPMVDACLRARAHYLDITGEVGVLEALSARHGEATAAGITLLPGAGFDVVPSDCLAAHVKRLLPSATHLVLAFQTSSRMSRGTATTAVENAHAGGLVRRDGKLTPVPAGWCTRSIDFGHGPRKAISIPWGDVATAYHSTGIGNVEVYVAVPLAVRLAMRATRYIAPLLASPAVRGFLTARVRQRPPGPSAEQRAHGVGRLWAEARDASTGAVARARLRTPEPYELTTWTALELAERAVRGGLPPGFQTPARACGPDFILGFPGIERHDLAPGP
jgi:short subunit dehydrogenase-like uncharacterized protein